MYAYMLGQLGPAGTKEYLDAKRKLDGFLMMPPAEVVQRAFGRQRVSRRTPPAWFAEADAAAAAHLAALPTREE